MKKRFISSVLLLGSVFPAAVIASTDSRLTGLEKLTEAQSELIYQMRQELSAAFRDIADLRGQLEYTTHQLNQTIERQKTILLQLNGGGEISASNNQTSNMDYTSSSEWVVSGNDKDDYNELIDLALKQKKETVALAGFQEFIKNYPNSTYLANATYWAGQLLYKQNKMDESSFYFASVVKNFPRSDKAADSMYKVGRIMESKGDKERAKSIYLEVIRKYPDAEIVKEIQQQLNK